MIATRLTEGEIMPSEHSATFQRHLLGRELRRLREAASMTSEDVARQMELSSISWAGRIEKGERGIQIRDLRRLLDLYGVTDGERREELLELARGAKKPNWWDGYKRFLPPTYAKYIGLEAGAAEIHIFQPLSVPGLLQTTAYARAQYENRLSEIEDEEVERRVEVRIKRQEILDKAEPPRLWAIIDEAALLRQVGGPEVMREQLNHMLKMARRKRITIQVLPFVLGAHPGTASSMNIIEFADKRTDPVPYIETVAGELYLQKKVDIETCTLTWQYLSAKAASPEDSIKIIRTRAKEY
jgi:transcriptional regulator with XRE-family HTH domain